MEKWRLISDPPLPGKTNMDRDLQILQEVSSVQAPPTLRLYRWSPPALSLGFSQKEEEVVDTAACRRLNVDVVQRPTGGRAVLHHQELTYSIVIPENHTLLPRGVLASYKFLSQGLLLAFSLLNIEAYWVPRGKRGQKPGPGACFDSSSAYEIQVKGKKVVGSAQLRRNGVLLQHGSILFKLYPALYSQILRKPEGKKINTVSYLKVLKRKAAGLWDLGYALDEKDLARALVTGFSQIFAVDFKEEKLF